jgi:6-phosphogluconolactonase
VNLIPAWHEFASPGELAEALATRVTQELRGAVLARGQALLAVSGGTTPKVFLRALSDEVLPWEKVTVTLVDERFANRDSNRSNERLVRSNLLRGPAEKARFLGLYSHAPSVEEAADRASERLSALPFPLDVAVLGMGLDGHTASFFPDAANLTALLDPRAPETVLPVHAPGAEEPRLSLSLARLMEARFAALHIEGSAKRELLASTLAAGGKTPSLPVQALFQHCKRSVEIYWAPNEDEIS